MFVRLSGCNLQCPFCDTDHDTFHEMSEEQIAEEVSQHTANLVVITGGEPAIQLTETLIDKLHAIGKSVAVETNGTMPLPSNLDWITVSPKEDFVGITGRVAISRADEVKVIFDGQHDPQPFSRLGHAPYLCLQPCDTGDARRNQDITRQCVDYILQHPEWHLSLQTHKWLDIK